MGQRYLARSHLLLERQTHLFLQWICSLFIIIIIIIIIIIVIIIVIDIIIIIISIILIKQILLHVCAEDCAKLQLPHKRSMRTRDTNAKYDKKKERKL